MTPVDKQLETLQERFNAGDFDAAAVLLDQILTASIDHPELLNLGAMIALRRQRPDIAEDFARRAVSVRPENAAFMYTWAQALAALKRPAEALTRLRQTLRIDPRFDKAHVRIWEIMGALGRLNELTSLLKNRLEFLDAMYPVKRHATRVKIEDTTLCCIDCNNYPLAIRALKLSLAGCEFPRAIFFTDRDFDLAPIEVARIQPIRSLQDYSTFVMKHLLRHIDTEYVLLVQWDGYIVNPESWSEQFQLFDYVGARWPHSVLEGHTEYDVGNGGFSLRSRALLEALQDDSIIGSHPEDSAICRTYRNYLETAHNITFAPAAVADQFSFEHIKPAGATFGFHGQINLARFIDDELIRLLEPA
jgi:tetratricopeptide (TPR) repeat protein